MKIAVVIDTWFPFVGGGQKNAWEISKIIASYGHGVDIITRNNGKTNITKSKNLKVYQLGKSTKIGDTIAQIKFCFQAMLFIMKNDYDVVHAHAFWPGFTLLATKIFKRIPTVFTVHGTSINSNLKGIIPKIIEAILLTKIPYTYEITVSRDILEIPNVNKNISYIPNAVDFKEFEKIRGQKKNKLQILFVGRLHPQKNVLKLIEAFNKVKKEKIYPKLVIAGNGPQKNEIMDKLKKLNLQKDVKILGEIKGTDLINLYKSSTLFILPSLYEGQPLSLLEAFASKLPPIVSAVGDNPYLVKNGVNGFIIRNPNNVDDIKSAIINALNSKKLDKMADYNYNFVKNNFSWQKSANLTIDVYKKIYF